MSETGEEPREPSQAVATDLHWGPVDNDLLYDTARYSRYALSHHAAAHAWSLWRLGEPLGPVGLAVGLPRRLAPSVVVEVEASAVLVEALAFEYARDLRHRADFGLTVADVDWDETRRHIGDIWRLAGDRGCRYTMQAGKVLGDQDWLHDTAWYALREWDEIASLADAIGRGRVLEPDEVDGLLCWWRA